MAAQDDLDDQIRWYQSLSAYSEETNRDRQREIAKLNKSKQEIQAEIEEIYGNPSKITKATHNKAASAIRAFGQLTQHRNSEKATKSARARRVE